MVMSPFTLGALSFCALLGAAFLPLCSSQTYLTPGTTKNLEAIFKGTCWSQQELMQPLIDEDEIEPNDCDLLWTAFYNSFAYKDPCNLTHADYKGYVDMVNFTLATSKALFWNNVYDLSQAYSNYGMRYQTLSTTLLGYTGDKINWCGQTASPGINYQDCLGQDKCPDAAQKAFWGLCSTKFAKTASGVAQVLVDGSGSEPAFTNDTYFATFELPNVRTDLVTLFRILVAHQPGKPIKETCGTGSIQELERLMDYYGHNWTCEDNPSDLLFLLCVDAATDPMCAGLINPPGPSRPSSSWMQRSSIGLLTSIIATQGLIASLFLL